jgi:hypothetical protein
LPNNKNYISTMTFPTLWIQQEHMRKQSQQSKSAAR